MLLINTILILLVISSIITDITKRRIYNIQTYPVMMLGLIMNFAVGGVEGLILSFLGLLFGMLLLLLFYISGTIGAGDVKLLAAIGALKGSLFTLETMFYTALIGGFMAIVIIAWQGTLIQTLKNSLTYACHPFKYSQDDSINHQYLPYGIAISIGCICTFITSYL